MPFCIPPELSGQLWRALFPRELSSAGNWNPRLPQLPRQTGLPHPLSGTLVSVQTFAASFFNCLFQKLDPPNAVEARSPGFEVRIEHASLPESAGRWLADPQFPGQLREVD